MKFIITLVLSIMLLIALTANARSTEMGSRIPAMTKEKDQKSVKSMLNIIREFQLDTLKAAEDIDVMKGEVALSFLNVGDSRANMRIASRPAVHKYS